MPIGYVRCIVNITLAANVIGDWILFLSKYVKNKPVRLGILRSGLPGGRTKPWEKNRLPPLRWQEL